MSMQYGNHIAGFVQQTAVTTTTGGWTALQVGSSPQARRAWVEIQVRGRSALALAYANRNNTTAADFTTPTNSIRNTIIIPAASIKVIPLGPDVALYGRVVPKAGSTQTSVKVVVVEYS